MSKCRIIVTGLIAQYPLGGVTWDYIQYVLGFRNLGHDVYYFEDTGQWPYNPITKGVGEDCEFNVRFLANVMRRFGLEYNWAYRFPWKSQWFGLSDIKRKEIIGSADVLINVSGSLAHPGEYREIPRLIYIDSDPVFTQVKLAKGLVALENLISLHDSHFSFGEVPSDTVPKTRFKWQPTRQPIVLSEWDPKPDGNGSYTTIMNWTSYKPLEHNGKTFAQKDVEFEKFLDLPQRVPEVSIEIAVNAGKTRRTPRDWLIHRGWLLADPDEVCPDFDSYRTYIQQSRAEWSVAKNGYVVGQSGWFSCRSACYLAAGKPVIVQSTGFESVLPTGEGILSFCDINEAVAAIEEVERNYLRHATVAREIAEQFFDSDAVLTNLLEQTTT